MSALTINVFTDPACPWAYSAEPTRWRLKWLFGDQITWKSTLIVLSGYAGETSPLTPEQVAHYAGIIREKYNMPIDTTVRPRLATSHEACKYIMGVRLHAPEHEEAFLRQLRIASMNNKFIDELPIIDEIISNLGIDSTKATVWANDEATSEELARNAEAARTPTNVGLAFRHKLSKTSTDRVRYSAPSYQFIQDDNVRFELPGFWPLEASEAAIGNLITSIERRADPENVIEVLKWAETPLATIEVARICNKDIEDVRKELTDNAQFEPVGQDGFWGL